MHFVILAGHNKHSAGRSAGKAGNTSLGSGSGVAHYVPSGERVQKLHMKVRVLVLNASPLILPPHPNPIWGSIGQCV